MHVLAFAHGNPDAAQCHFPHGRPASFSEKKRLQQLARNEKVSSSEIIRRSIHAYAELSAKSASEEQAAIAAMSQALDESLALIKSARKEVSANLAEVRRLRGEKK